MPAARSVAGNIVFLPYLFVCASRTPLPFCRLRQNAYDLGVKGHSHVGIKYAGKWKQLFEGGSVQYLKSRVEFIVSTVNCNAECALHGLYNIASCCREYQALNVYIAQCYFKLNYYDMSQVSH